MSLLLAIRRPADEAYDQDGNPLQDFYDWDPPGVGSPVSALRDAYALYYPADRRYKPPAFRPWLGPDLAGGTGWGLHKSGPFYESPEAPLPGQPQKISSRPRWGAGRTTD